MSKVLMMSDDGLIANTNQALSQLTALLNELNEMYKAIDSRFVAGMQMSDCQSLLENEFFLEDKMIGDVQNPTISGIPVGLDKIREMIRLPIGATAFKEKQKALKVFNEFSTMRWFAHYDCLKVENAAFVIDQTQLNKKLDSFRYYAETDKQKQWWEKIKQLPELLEMLSTMNGYPVDIDSQYVQQVGLSKQYKIKLEAARYISQMGA